MLRQQLNEKDSRLDAAVMKLNSQSSAPRGSNSNSIERVAKTEPADTTTQDTMVLVMAFLMAMMLGVVICLCCHIRTQRKRRAEDAVKLMHQKKQIDYSESDSERATPAKGGPNVAVVGGAGVSQLTEQNR